MPEEPANEPDGPMPDDIPDEPPPPPSDRPQLKTSGPMPVPAWMLTFADCMSLLLTFFVLLLTFSTTNEEDFKKASGGLSGTLGNLLEVEGDSPPSIVKDRIALAGRASSRGPEGPPELGPSALSQLSMNVRMKAAGLGTAVTAVSGRAGFLLRLKSDDVFVGQTAELSKEGSYKLAKIAGVVQYLPNDIEIAAHTDGNGDAADIELSISRGTAAAMFIAKCRAKGDPAVSVVPKRMGVCAPGGTVPLETGGSAIAAARNRRLEITVLKYSH